VQALVSAEEHGVVDGVSGSAPLLGSHACPRMTANWGVIGSEATPLGVGYFGEIRQEGNTQTWRRATTAAVVGTESVDGPKHWR
jgi:hypothetical protein